MLAAQAGDADGAGCPKDLWKAIRATLRTLPFKITLICWKQGKP